MVKPLLSALKRILSKNEPRNAKLPLLFLHMPKTAGTSFRYAIDRSRRVKNLIADYGKDSTETTPWLKQLRYQTEPEDEQAVFNKLSTEECFCLTGHFRCERYSKAFYPYQISMFVRDPLERLLSDFYYKKRKGHTELTLEKHIEKKPFQNRQSKLLGQLAPEYYGFLGLSNRYKESLECFNELFDLDLTELTVNQNPDKKRREYSVPDSLTSRIEELNKQDYRLFEKSLKLFEMRKNMLNQNAYALYGAYTVDGSKIIGRAYRAYTETPVSLEIKVNEQRVGLVLADLANPIPADVKQPRNGDIGFEFFLDQPLKEGDQLSVSAENSSEVLIYTEVL